MKILTIERAKWRRGGDAEDLVEKFGYTALLNNKGMMCCLGFDALACGAPVSEILNRESPEDLDFINEEYSRTRLFDTGEFYFENADAVRRAMDINDKESMPDQEREDLVRATLLQLGWDDVVFV